PAGSCRAPSRFYSTASVRRTFAEHGLSLEEPTLSPPADGPPAFVAAIRAGLYRLLETANKAVVILAPTPLAPLWLDKLSLNCQQTYNYADPIPAVLGNLGVSYQNRVARKVQAALTDLERSGGNSSSTAAGLESRLQVLRAHANGICVAMNRWHTGASVSASVDRLTKVVSSLRRFHPALPAAETNLYRAMVKNAGALSAFASTHIAEL